MFDLSQVQKIKTDAVLEQELTSKEALAYLASTDWFGLRLLEENKPIPPDILAARSLARSKVIA